MNKQTEYAGIRLKHPIIAASAGTTRDLKHCLMCEDAGFSAVILKSVQEEVLMRHNPFPRFKLLRSGVRGYESCTFYCYEQAYEGDLENYCATVAAVKNRLSVPVIASINCIRPESWPEYAKACEQAGADALEIVPSCPTGMLMRDASTDIRTLLLHAMNAVRDSVSIPVVPKMTSQLADIPGTACELDRAGADGITMINRATGIDIDVDKQAPILHGGFAGHGGSWALSAVLRWIVAVQPLVSAPICATGGVMTGDDVIKCLLAGARSVQIATLIYLKGYACLGELLRRVDGYMEEKGIGQIGEIVGLAARKTKKMEEYDRVTRYHASCERSRCVKCRACEPVCIYEALHFESGKPLIDTVACDGCGLCAAVCGAGAINMVRRSE